MASVKGVNITKLDNSTGKLSKQEKGKVRIWTDSFEATGEAIGSDITICRLPKNSTVVEATIYHDALGASSTLIMGDATDDNRYITSGSTATAGVKTLNAIDGIGYENTTQTDLILTTAGGTVTGTIKVIVKYLV